jgi:tape measure domain-containing protein
MSTIGSIQAVVGAVVEEAGFQRAEAALGGIGTAAQQAAATATGALGQIGAAADAAAGRYVDSAGKWREANGRFSSSAQIAAQNAALLGGSLGGIGNAADASADTINGQLVQAFKEYDKAIKPLEASVGRLGSATKSLGQDLTVGLTLPIVAGGVAALAAAGKFEALGKGLQAVTEQQLADQGVTGLTAVSQAATQTAQDLVDLKEISRAPGIGFEQAVQGAVRLEVVGESATEAKTALKEFANAIALTGGSAASLDLVTVQLAQLASKGKVLSTDLRPIIEQAPEVASALQKIFGSIDPEEISAQLEKTGKNSRDFINDLVGELGKLPRVAGGLSNSFENFGQTVEQSLGKVGAAISEALDLPALLESISTSIEQAADSFAALDPGTQSFIIGLVATAAAVGPVLVAVGGILAVVPQVVAGFGLVSTALSGTGTAALALATGPLGIALAAVTALAGGLYYLATANERAIDSYRDQAKATNQVTTAVAPLLARYTELSEKLNRTEAEQTELNSVMQQLAELVPGATTAIDQYGKATGISTKAVSEYTAALQQQKEAQAALALPAAQAELDKLATKYAVLKKQADEFNRTGAIKVAVFDAGGGSLETYRAGSQAVLELQANLANANVEFQKQKGLVDELRGSTTKLAEEDASLAGALQSVGLAGAAATGGVLEGLRERLKELKDARENATTTSGTLAFNPLIDAVERQIAQLVDTSKKGADAITKLRQELARLGALDNLLGNAPSQVEVLERRINALTTGLKSLFDSGVSTSSRAFQGLVADLTNTSKALDKLRAAGGSLDLKPVNVKSLIPQTIGDTLDQDVARLLGDYAKQAKPFELPISVKLNMQSILDTPRIDNKPYQLLNEELIKLGQGFSLAEKEAAVFGSESDEVSAKAEIMHSTLERLLKDGFSPLGPEVQELAAQYRALAEESQRTAAVSSTLQSGIVDLAAGIADAISGAVQGTASLGDGLLQVLLGTIGTVATKLGEILLASGLGIEALKAGLAAFTGIGAIAAGIGLLAIGGLAKGAAANIGKSSGSPAYAPSSNYSASAPASNGGLKIEVGELKLRGAELAAVLRVVEYRSLRTG